MISRPSFLILLVSLLGLGVAVWLLFAPPDVLWHRIDPVGHAVWNLRNATSFTAPALDDIGALESPLRDWRTVAHSAAADSTFRALASAPGRVTRLYAVAGLALTDSVGAARAASAFASDPAIIQARLEPCARYVAEPVRVLAALVSRPTYARYLLAGSPACVGPRLTPPV